MKSLFHMTSSFFVSSPTIALSLHIYKGGVTKAALQATLTQPLLSSPRRHQHEGGNIIMDKKEYLTLHISLFFYLPLSTHS